MGHLLGWDVVGWALALLVTVGLGIVTLANYYWAKFFFGISAAILAAKLALITRPVWPEVGFLALALSLILVILWLWFRRLDELELRDSTRLRPGNRPTPPHKYLSAVPDGALMVFLGSNLAWATRMPHTVLQAGETKLLEINKRKRNELVVSVLRIYGKNGDILARIDPDGFFVEPSLRRKRPDKSTLVVYDRGDTEVLRVTLLNRRALSVTGIFRAKNTPDVVVNSESLKIGGVTMSDSAMGESGGADIMLS